MAGVLARQLGGAVSYEGEPAFRATLGVGPRPDAESLHTALSVYRRACLMLWIIVAVWIVVMVPGAFFMFKHTFETLTGSSS